PRKRRSRILPRLRSSRVESEVEIRSLVGAGAVNDMNEDMIARLASRIYQETSLSNGSAAPQPPSPPEPPTSPTNIPSHLGSVPLSIGSCPLAASMPQPSTAALQQDTVTPDNAEGAARVASSPESLAYSPVGAEPLADAKSSDGLSDFIRKIRQLSLSN